MKDVGDQTRIETSGPAAMPFLIVGTAVFAAIVVLSSLGAMAGPDRAFMLAMRDAGDAGMPDGPPWLVQTVIDISALGGYPVIVVLMGAAALIFLSVGKLGDAVFLVATMASGTLANHYLKLGFSRERPDLIDHLLDTHTASFPSGHAMMSAIFYITLALLLANMARNRAVRAALFCSAIFITLIVGLSRIYLGVHWPSDVMAGWAVAAAWIGLCLLVSDLLERRRQRPHVR